MELRSKYLTSGANTAPQRSLLYACGFSKEELERPLVGVVSAHSDIVPGHIHLDKLTEAVKAGVRMAGGTPIMIPSIGVCDGIAMGHVGMNYSLASRELIADSVETMVNAHCLDGVVLVPNCDKIVPGMVMAAVRMNIPAVVVSGGPMMAGVVDKCEVSLSKMFEAVGAYKAGIIDDDGLTEFEKKVCPTCGSCSGMYTANSMNCLCEAIGIALPGNGTIPAVMTAQHHGFMLYTFTTPEGYMMTKFTVNGFTLEELTESGIAEEYTQIKRMSGTVVTYDYTIKLRITSELIKGSSTPWLKVNDITVDMEIAPITYEVKVVINGEIMEYQNVGGRNGVTDGEQLSVYTMPTVTHFGVSSIEPSLFEGYRIKDTTTGVYFGTESGYEVIESNRAGFMKTGTVINGFYMLRFVGENLVNSDVSAGKTVVYFIFNTSSFLASIHFNFFPV